MTNSPNWSGASDPCRRPPERAGVRLEWRPSRGLVAALALIGVLAAISVLASAMPSAMAWPGATVAAGWGLWLARRESRAPGLYLRLHASGAVEVDGVPVEDFRVAWRGPMAFASWQDGAGCRRRLVWWPGTLSPRARRELRLATRVEGAALPDAPVAH